MPRVVQESLSVWDVKDHIEYLASRDTDVALRFIDAVEAGYQQIGDNPDTGFLGGFESERLRDVRAIFVPGFPNHVIYFRKRNSEVRVLRVLHASRDITREFRE